MRTNLILASVVLVAAAVGASGQSIAPPAAPVPAPARQAAVVVPALAGAPVEVCFVLDTTSSMSGLINGAKRKIWSMANEIVAANPKRPLQIGLIAYRDRGDAYITKRVELTNDLDALYQKLTELRAEGGGDGPESVNQALQEAVEKITWSKDAGALKLIFLVGDYPPHMDYQDDVKYPAVCEAAVKKGLIINTVLCGDNAETRTVWEDIAKKSEGVFLGTTQTGSMAVVATPMDDKLAKLNGELNKTVVAYGSRKVQAEVTAKAAGPAAMPAESVAERAKFNLRDGGRAVQGNGDLVQDLKADKDLLGKLKAEELSPELQKMTAAERQAFVEKQAARREEINKQIAEVSKERDAFIAAEQKKQNGKGDSFDQKVSEVIRAQAAKQEKK